MLTIVPIWIFCGIVAVTIANSKGHRDFLTLFSCLALGPMGIVLAMKKQKPKMFCPYCNESVDVDKDACSLCGLTIEERDRTGETVVSKQCLVCKGKDVHDAYLENGSWGKWCPHCKMSIKKMRKR